MKAVYTKAPRGVSGMDPDVARVYRARAALGYTMRQVAKITGLKASAMCQHETKPTAHELREDIRDEFRIAARKLEEILAVRDAEAEKPAEAMQAPAPAPAPESDSHIARLRRQIAAERQLIEVLVMGGFPECENRDGRRRYLDELRAAFGQARETAVNL